MVSFDTQIDPIIHDIIITRPPTKGWPAIGTPGTDTFAIVDDGGAVGIRGLTFVKNYQFRVRFDPSDPAKATPNPRDILVTYKVPSQPDKNFIVDQSKVPAWVQESDTEVILIFSYTKVPLKWFFTSATSRKCLNTSTTPTITTTVTPTITTTVTPTPGACYDLCTTDAACGSHIDPTTGASARMKCLEARRGGIIIRPESIVNFFLNADQGLLAGAYPYRAENYIYNEDTGAISTYIPGTTWRNSDNITGVFKDADNRARVLWETDSVPVAYQDRSFNITLEGLPAEYEITQRFCTGGPAVCGTNFSTANNPTTSDPKTVNGIRIVKDGNVVYGWHIRRKRLATSATTIPVTIALPTTTVQAHVCDVIVGKVPTTDIQNARSNPASIPSWNPPTRIKLSMVNIALPYNATTNGLIFRDVCPVAPTPTLVVTSPTSTVAPSISVRPSGVVISPTIRPIGGHAACNPALGVPCRCMPPSCTGRDCSTKPLACERPTTPTITVPTTTVTPTVGPSACVFNAMAFVEECKEINPTTGECMPILGTGRLNASPLPDSVLKGSDPIWKMWGAMNNRQAVNPRRLDTDRPPVNDRFRLIDTTMAAFSDILTSFPLFNFANNRTEGISITGRQKSTQEVTVADKRELLNPGLGGVKIATDKEIRAAIKPTDDITAYVPNEQYNNMEDASVKIFYDTNNYRILPNGKNIYSCTNSIARELQAAGKLNPATDLSIINKAAGLGACNMAEFNKITERDTIGGLTVGCGQDIVYGWTLQKCSFNYDIVFVLDTSTTMGMPDKNLGGQRKIDAAVDQVELFIDGIERSGSDSRIALVNFNNAVHVYQNGNGTGIKDNDGDGFGNGVQTRGLIGRSNFNDVRAQLPRFRKMKAEGGLIEKGSCQKCGLDLANQILQEKRTDAEKQARPGVVIFLTDGLPNSYAGDADPDVMSQYPPEARGNVEPWGWAGIYASADRLRNDGTTTPAARARTPGINGSVFDDVLLAAITFGDENKKENEGSDFYQFSFSVASATTDGKGRWAFSTDPSNLSPISIASIFADIQRKLNTCVLAALAYDTSLKARDINNDGIVNTVDLFLIYEKYYQKGDNIPEDVNADGVVNALDVSLVLQSIGTVVNTTQ